MKSIQIKINLTIVILIHLFPQSLSIFCHIPVTLEFEVFSLGTEITMWREEKSELRKVVRHAHYETAMRR